MKFKVTLFLGLAMLLWITTSTCSPGTEDSQDSPEASLQSPTASTGVTWYNYDEGMALGKKEGRKILLHFYADWCGYCRKMDAETFSKTDVADYMNRNFIPIRLNSDRETQLAEKYRVSGLPTTWFMDKDGEKIQSLPGYLPKEMFMAYMKFIQTDSFQNMSFRDFMDVE